MRIMKKLFTSLSPKILFLSFILSLSFTSVNAQIWNNIGSKVNDKIKRKADQKVEQKIDKTIDKGFDKTEEKIDESFQKSDDSTKESKAPKESKESTASKGFDMSSMFGGTPDMRDEYKFKFGVTYKMTSTNSKGKTQDAPTMTMWMAESGITGIHTNEQNSTIILDIEKETMVIIQETEKTYMAIKSDMKAATEKIVEKIGTTNKDIEQQISDTKVEKIGAEKILGYNCDIYKITTKDGESKIWSTQDIDFDYSKMAGGFSNSFGGKQKSSLPNVKGMPTGMLLKMISTNNKTKDSMTMEATEIFKNGNTYIMSNYKKMGMQ